MAEIVRIVDFLNLSTPHSAFTSPVDVEQTTGRRPPTKSGG